MRINKGSKQIKVSCILHLPSTTHFGKLQNVQHDITSPVWIYNDSRDLFKVNTECYHWWQQSCYNWYAGELEEKYDWLDDGIIWT